MKTIISKQFRLQGRDWIKGAGLALAIAAVYPVVNFLTDWLAAGNSLFDADYKKLIDVAVSGLLSYLAKNLLEPTKVVNVITGIQAEGIAEAEKQLNK